MMLPSEYNQDFAAQRRAMMGARRLRERATGDSILGVEKQSNGTFALLRLEDDCPGSMRETLETNFPTAQVALKAAHRVARKTREDIKMVRDDLELKSLFSESLMKAEFPTQQDAGVFMFQVGSPGKRLAKFKNTLPKKVGRNFEVEFLAPRGKSGAISDIARKNNGKLSFTG